jgi:voltage-gated potassium channel
VGLALRDSGIRQKLNIIVVAIKRASGEMLFNPSPGTQIFAGDTLIALGMRQSLDELEKMAGS